MDGRHYPVRQGAGPIDGHELLNTAPVPSISRKPFRSLFHKPAVHLLETPQSLSCSSTPHHPAPPPQTSQTQCHRVLFASKHPSPPNTYGTRQTLTSGTSPLGRVIKLTRIPAINSQAFHSPSLPLHSRRPASRYRIRHGRWEQLARPSTAAPGIPGPRAFAGRPRHADRAQEYLDTEASLYAHEGRSRRYAGGARVYNGIALPFHTHTHTHTHTHIHTRTQGAHTCHQQDPPIH